MWRRKRIYPKSARQDSKPVCLIPWDSLFLLLFLLSFFFLLCFLGVFLFYFFLEKRSLLPVGEFLFPVKLWRPALHIYIHSSLTGKEVYIDHVPPGCLHAAVHHEVGFAPAHLDLPLHILSMWRL